MSYDGRSEREAVKAEISELLAENARGELSAGDVIAALYELGYGDYVEEEQKGLPGAAPAGSKLRRGLV